MSTKNIRAADALSALNAVYVPQPDIPQASNGILYLDKPFTLHVQGFQPEDGVDFESCNFIFMLKSPVGGTQKYLISDEWPFSPDTEYQQTFTNNDPKEPFEPRDAVCLTVLFRHRNTRLSQTHHADYICQ